MAENNLDEVGRRSRAPGSQQANAEELLAELARLVDSSGPSPDRSRPPAGTVSEPTRTDTDPMRRREMTSLRPSVEAPSSKPGETGAIYVEPPRAPESNNSYSNDPTGTDLAAGRRAGAWTFRVSALVLVGAAVLGSIFWLKRAEPGLPNAPSITAATEGPTTTQPRSNSAVATSSGAGSTLSNVTQPGPGKGASPEVQPIDPNAHLSLNHPPQSDLAPPAIGAPPPTADASTAKPLAAPVNTPTAAPPIAAPQPMASQSPDLKPVPTVSLPPELDAARDADPLHCRTGRSGAPNSCAIAARQARAEDRDRGGRGCASADV